MSSFREFSSRSLLVTAKTNLRPDHSTVSHADRLSPQGQSYSVPPWPLARAMDSDCLCLLVVLFSLIPCAAEAAQPIHYVVDLRVPETHLVQVTLNIPGASAGTEIQIPTWNCLYQIRDFVKNVEDMKGDCDGQPADLKREDLNTGAGQTDLQRPRLPLLSLCQR